MPRMPSSPSQVLEAGPCSGLCQRAQRVGHRCARRLRGVQAPNGRWATPGGGKQGGRPPPPRPGLSQPSLHLQHNLCCDNCHSHVALALNLMRYNNSTNWNMVTLCFFCLLYGKYVR